MNRIEMSHFEELDRQCKDHMRSIMTEEPNMPKKKKEEYAEDVNDLPNIPECENGFEINQALDEIVQKPVDNSVSVKERENSKFEVLDLGSDSVQRFINAIVDGFQENVDFGYPFPGAPKKSLWKGGAEQVCLRFNLDAKFEKDQDTLDMVGQTGIIAFKCSLVHRPTGMILGEGRGIGQIGEKKMTINNIVKITEKRAQVDAVLRAFALSGRFTQDVEDMSNDDMKPLKSKMVIQPDGDFK